MTRIIMVFLVALLSFGGLASEAMAKAEMPMFYKTDAGDGKANLVVERLIRASLKIDWKGNAYIQGTPCLTPNMLLAAIRRDHPDVKIDGPGDLPGLFHSLIAHKARAEGFTGTYDMSRLSCSRPGSLQKGDGLDPTDFPREFRLDEYVYFLPNHTDPFTAEDCTNIVKMLAKLFPPPPPLPPPPQVAQEVPCDHLLIAFPGGSTLHQNMAARRPLERTVCSRKLQFFPGGRGRYSLCNTCVMEDSIDMLKQKGYLVVSQPGMAFNLTCTKPVGTECIVDETLPPSVGDRKVDDIWLNCFVDSAGNRSLVKDIHWRSFHNGQAWIVFGSSEAPSSWIASGGLPNVWTMVGEDQEQ